MLSSKDVHFSYLEELDRKYQTGGQRTLAEIAHLKDLLATHDRCVTAFAGAMRELGETDAEAHSQLIQAIADLNSYLMKTL